MFVEHFGRYIVHVHTVRISNKIGFFLRCLILRVPTEQLFLFVDFFLILSGASAIFVELPKIIGLAKLLTFKRKEHQK